MCCQSFQISSKENKHAYFRHFRDILQGARENKNHFQKLFTGKIITLNLQKEVDTGKLNGTKENTTISKSAMFGLV